MQQIKRWNKCPFAICWKSDEKTISWRSCNMTRSGNVYISSDNVLEKIIRIQAVCLDFWYRSQELYIRSLYFIWTHLAETHVYYRSSSIRCFLHYQLQKLPNSICRQALWFVVICGDRDSMHFVSNLCSWFVKRCYTEQEMQMHQMDDVR